MGSSATDSGARWPPTFRAGWWPALAFAGWVVVSNVAVSWLFGDPSLVEEAT
jgi:hypothetical protein